MLNQNTTHLEAKVQALTLDPDGYSREHEIVSSKKKGTKGILPFSRTTWLNGVKSGKYPKPVKINRINIWRNRDLLKLRSELWGADERFQS